jgi:CubicO group peptidase (beta-lactamase class C family)
MYARKLDFAPGTENHYSNYGYLLLSALVEKLTGQDFFTYVKTALLQPAGITEVLLSSTLASERAPNEAICEDEGLGLSPIDLNSQLLTPAVYGGDGQIKEVAAGCAGIAASATALVQFISNHAVWWVDSSKGERTPGYARSGSTPGTSTWAESRAGGIDLAFCINARNWPPQSPSPTLNDLTKSIDALLEKASL